MNAGFSNRGQLKAWLLAASMQSSTEWDDQILAIGLGVAAHIEQFCDRQFARATADVFECSADRDHIVLPRYPVESIATIEQSVANDVEATWTELTSPIQSQSLDRGLIYFDGFIATYRERLRITYAGGYWWNQQESDYDPPDTPTEENPDLSAKPTGATAIPDNLVLAWRLQCEHLWGQRDRLGLNVAKDQKDIPADAPTVAPLLPSVQAMLYPFIRYSLY